MFSFPWFHLWLCHKSWPISNSRNPWQIIYLSADRSIQIRFQGALHLCIPNYILESLGKVKRNFFFPLLSFSPDSLNGNLCRRGPGVSILLTLPCEPTIQQALRSKELHAPVENNQIMWLCPHTLHFPKDVAFLLWSSFLTLIFLHEDTLVHPFNQNSLSTNVEAIGRKI